MPTSDGFRKYFEAGAVLGHVTRARAEEIVRELVNAGEIQRGQASEWVDDLVERSRKASEEFVAVVRREVKNQLDALNVNPDDLAKQVADILRHSADVGRAATTDAAKRAGKTAKAAKKAADRMAGTRPGAEKAGTKKAGGTKKATPKKPATKRPATTKAAAKKVSGTKTAAAKKATPKKPATKRPAAKKAGAKKAVRPSTGSAR